MNLFWNSEHEDLVRPSSQLSIRINHMIYVYLHTKWEEMTFASCGFRSPKFVVVVVVGPNPANLTSHLPVALAYAGFVSTFWKLSSTLQEVTPGLAQMAPCQFEPAFHILIWIFSFPCRKIKLSMTSFPTTLPPSNFNSSWFTVPTTKF